MGMEKGFVYADEAEVQQGIAADDVTGDKYDGTWIGDEDGGDDDGQAADAADADEGEQGTSGEDGDDQTGISADAGGLPKPTGDPEKDGVAANAYKLRERARTAEEAQRKAEETQRRAEQEVAYLKGRAEGSGLRSPAAPTAPDTPDFDSEEKPEFDFENPNESLARIQAWEGRRHQAVAEWETKKQAAASVNEASQKWQEAADASEKVARMRHPDYDQVFNRFKARLQTPGNEAIQTLVMQHPDPANYGYTLQLEFEANEKDSVSELDRLRAENAELKKGGKKKPPTQKSMAGARGGSPRSRGATGPKTMEAAFSGMVTDMKKGFAKRV